MSSDSESDDSDILSTLPQRLRSPGALRLLLRQAEAQKNELRKANKGQQKQLADMENDVNDDAEQSSRDIRKKRSTASDDSDMNELRLIASKFTYMSCLWLRKIEYTFKLDADPDYQPGSRFANTSNKCQGQFQDLLAVIPEKLHHWMKDDHIVDMFRSEMNQQRSNGCKRVRREAGTAIFNVLDKDLETAESRFKKFAELIGWVESEHVGEYKAFAPILYSDDDGEDKRDRIFRNDILLKTWKALTQGPSSIKGGNFAGSRVTLQSKWRIESITPGAIAASAIFARYAASADDQLQCHGRTTNIPYLEDFETYLRYLTEGLRRKKKSVVAIFSHWNSNLFPSHGKKLKNLTGKTQDSDLDLAFADLSNDSEIEDGGDEGEDNNVRPASNVRDPTGNVGAPMRNVRGPGDNAEGNDQEVHIEMPIDEEPRPRANSNDRLNNIPRVPLQPQNPNVTAQDDTEDDDDEPDVFETQHAKRKSTLTDQADSSDTGDQPSTKHHRTAGGSVSDPEDEVPIPPNRQVRAKPNKRLSRRINTPPEEEVDHGDENVPPVMINIVKAATKKRGRPLTKKTTVEKGKKGKKGKKN